MNVHELKLDPRYYDYILYGTKRIELRLYDEKRQKIRIGDKIRFFKEPDSKESFVVNVTGVFRYDSFLELFNDFDIPLLADKSMNKEELLEVLSVFYTKEQQDKYGVLGIRIELEK